jgi:hypothetical protein
MIINLAIEDLYGSHHGFVVERHTFTSPHSRCGSCEICKDEERLATHFRAFGSDNIDESAISCEKGEKLGSKLLLVDFFVEIIDVQRCVWMSCHWRSQGADKARTCVENVNI